MSLFNARAVAVYGFLCMYSWLCNSWLQQK